MAIDLKRVFAANRREIAVRIIHACRRLGLESIVGVSAADRRSKAALTADRAVCIGPAPSIEGYLKMEAVVTAAKGTECDALHSGYGYFSSNRMTEAFMEGFAPKKGAA